MSRKKPVVSHKSLQLPRSSCSRNAYSELQKFDAAGATHPGRKNLLHLAVISVLLCAQPVFALDSDGDSIDDAYDLDDDNDGIPDDVESPPIVQTYSATGGDQFANIGSVPIDANGFVWIQTWGAAGSGRVRNGAGGYAQGYYNFLDLPASVLLVVGEGGRGASSDGNPTLAGYGGGGNSGGGTVPVVNSGAGGGLAGVFSAASFATATQSDAIIIAGGGVVVALLEEGSRQVARALVVV